MPVISTLTVELRLMAQNYANEIKAAQREAKEFEKTIKPIKDVLKDMGTAMTAIGGAVLASFAAMTKMTADYGDSLNDARQMTGVAVDDLSRLKFAAEQSGSSFEGLTTGLRFLSRNMDEAARGSKEQERAFRSLGIAVTDSTGRLRPANDVMLDIADRFSKMKDGADKTAIAMDIFGRSGAELIPMLNAGRAGLQAMGDTAQRTGQVISNETALAADEFNDRLLELQGAMQGISITVGTVFLPILTDLFQSTADVVSGFREWAEAHPGLIKVIGGLAVAITGTGGLLLGAAGVLTILPKLQVAFTALTGPVGLTVIAVTGLIAAIIHFRNEIGTVLLAALATLMQGFEGVLNMAEKVARAVGQHALADQIGQAADATRGYRSEIDRMVAAGMAQTMTIAATEKQLQAEAAARTKAATATTEHTLVLTRNTKEQEEAQKTIAKIIKDNQADMVGAVREIEAQASRSIKAITDTHQANIAANKRLADELLNSLDISEMVIASADTARGVIAPTMTELMNDLNRTIPPINPQIKIDIEKEKQKLKDATEDVKRSAGEVFDAMFLKGENVFSSLRNLLKGGVLSLGRSIFEDITGALLGPIKKAFDDFFEGLLESTGIRAFMSGLGDKLGGLLSGVFGVGGGAGGAISGAGGAAGGIPGIGGAGSAVGAGGSLGAGILSGAIGALGGIIGGLMGEGNAKRTEENTRETRDWLELMARSWDPVVHGQFNFIKDWVLPTIGECRDHLAYISSMMPNKFQVEAIMNHSVAAASIPAPPSYPQPISIPSQPTGGTAQAPVIVTPTIHIMASSPAETGNALAVALETDGDLRSRIASIFGGRR